MSSHVRVLPADLDLEVLAGETLIEAAWRQGYYWPTICQGQGVCLQCYTIVEDGSPNIEPAQDSETHSLAHLAEFVDGSIRLACQMRLRGDAVVTRTGVRAAGGRG